MRAAPSCRALLNQATKAWPNRNTASDGILPDARHLHKASDHNPNRMGYCRAVDLDHDPAHGCDCHVIFDAIKLARDPRVKYIIFNGRYWSPNTGERTYHGADPHRGHIHVSIKNTMKAILDIRAWPGVIKQPPPLPFPRLTGKLDKAVIKKGEQTWFYGYLKTKPVRPNQIIKVQYLYRGAAWRNTASAVTDTTGRWGVICNPKATTKYRAYYSGNTKYKLKSMACKTVTLTVKLK